MRGLAIGCEIPHPTSPGSSPGSAAFSRKGEKDASTGAPGFGALADRFGIPWMVNTNPNEAREPSS